MATTKGADDMTLSDAFDGYRYEDTDPRPIHRVVMPTILSVFKKLVAQNGGTPLSVFDIGCGNGYAANVLSNNGCVVSGVDLSAHGVAQAKAAFPHLDVRVGSAYDDLPVVFGTFDAVLSLEVVEHLYSPHKLANSAFGLLRPGGSVVVSTPYHGYWKNLAISLANKWDSHFDSLEEHQHIKFFSVATLTKLLIDAGFSNVVIRRVGRIPPLAESMIAVATR